MSLETMRGTQGLRPLQLIKMSSKTIDMTKLKDSHYQAKQWWTRMRRPQSCSRARKPDLRQS